MLPEWYHDVIFAAIILLISYITARNSQRNGLPFWRSFVMAVLGFTGLGLIALKIAFSLFG